MPSLAVYSSFITIQLQLKPPQGEAVVKVDGPCFLAAQPKLSESLQTPPNCCRARRGSRCTATWLPGH